MKRIVANALIAVMLLAKPADANPRARAIEAGMIQGGCPPQYARRVAPEIWEDLQINGFSAGLILYAEKSQMTKSLDEAITNAAARGIPVAIVLCYEGFLIEKYPIGAMREIGRSIIQGDTYVYHIKTKIWVK